MRIYSDIGVQVADILLPVKGTDLRRWATIACDQFTSQPEYWEQVAQEVADAPSTFNLILPEVYLGKPEEMMRIQTVQKSMRRYIDQDLFDVHSGIIYVERTSLGKTRRGLILALDLEKYDYNAGSQSLIRATEGTILDRLPPRMRIREGAALELPHILVLIDDPDCAIIESVHQQPQALTPLYDFELMQGSGHLRGALIQDLKLERQIMRGFEKLAHPDEFYSKYAVNQNKGILLFAVGDGNHSLATAKAIWEKLKPCVGMHHPARYALVEIENVHDQGLTFEPIHRVVFGAQQPVTDAMQRYFSARLSLLPCASSEDMIHRVNAQSAPGHSFGSITPHGFFVASVAEPASNLPVGTLQAFLDDWLKQPVAESIDYVHGEDILISLASQPGNCGFYLPAMNKSDLFKTVIMDGALPRKTFSMGEAIEKRFYMEARKII